MLNLIVILHCMLNLIATTLISACFISETWLHSAISSSLICPPAGYGIAGSAGYTWRWSSDTL
jgi:hypothetical protein